MEYMDCLYCSLHAPWHRPINLMQHILYVKHLCGFMFNIIFPGISSDSWPSINVILPGN